MSKFTPGPWQSGGCAVYQASGDYVADLVSGVANPNRDPDETEANGHLIAAAPDLHEALQELCDKCEPLTGDLSYEASPMSYVPCLVDVLLCVKRAVEDAEAALAKARGEA